MRALTAVEHAHGVLIHCDLMPCFVFGCIDHDDLLVSLHGDTCFYAVCCCASPVLSHGGTYMNDFTGLLCFTWFVHTNNIALLVFTTRPMISDVNIE